MYPCHPWNKKLPLTSANTACCGPGTESAWPSPAERIRWHYFEFCSNLSRSWGLFLQSSISTIYCAEQNRIPTRALSRTWPDDTRLNIFLIAETPPISPEKDA